MKLLTPFTAIIAAAAAGHIYTSQPAEAYANSAEIYQSALEYQQQGAHSDQSHAFAGQSTGADQLHAYAGHGDAGQSQAYAGHGHSRPAGEKAARILSSEFETDGHGYKYSYETENGIKAQEVGHVAGHESGTEAHGAYSYKGDDGHVYTVTYTADEHGFHAQGAHLPTPPPIPEAIVKSLEQNAKDEAAGVYDDGQYAGHHESQEVIHHGHGHASGGQQAQAFQYETSAIQHEFQPSQHLGYQLAGHQEGPQQSGHVVAELHGKEEQQSGHLLQLSGQGVHQQSGHVVQLSGQGGHQQSGHLVQLTGQGGHQQGHLMVGVHGEGQIQGQQGSQGYPLGHGGQQPMGFQPSGFHINVADEYRKH